MKSNLSRGKAFFKMCANCRQSWETRHAFLADSCTEIIGYQADFRELTEGLFLFNHTCGSTMRVKAQFFIDLYDGPMFRDCLAGSEECMGYCHIRNNLLPCPSKCECAYVREILCVIQHWPGNVDVPEKYSENKQKNPEGIVITLDIFNSVLSP